MERPRYDVFLSHMSGDKPAVEELARILKRKGIEPWLDKWNLVPGAPWQAAIEGALENCSAVAVCIGPSGTGPWQNEEMRAAIDLRVTDKEGDFRVIPVLLPGGVRGERSRLPRFLAATTWVEFRDKLDDEFALHRLVCGIRGIEPGPGPTGAVAEGACPFRGLEFFDVDDSLFFFGREALTEWLLDKLRPSRTENRFLAIVGPSGSGKSSLARAGLLAGVKSGELPGSTDWPTAILKPGAEPLESLAVALAKAARLGDASSLLNLISNLGKDARTLHLTTRLALHDAPDEQRIVVLVDQFEEIFTLCNDDGERQALIDNLLHAATAADGRTIVLLTLRADFYGRCAADPGLAAALSDRQVLVGAMAPDELRRAIERPGALAGCELESGLAELLLEEVEGRPGSLPLLQHALLELWNRRRGNRLTLEAYHVIGGVKGALEKHAEKIYEDLGAEQEICRRVLLRLVQIDETTAPTRCRLLLDDLKPADEAGAKAVEDVVRKLADARLLTTGETDNPTVELAHEALITNWKRLKDWIEADREALLVRRRLDDAIREWLENKKDPSYLYRDARLSQAEVWASTRAAELTRSEREFLDASLALRDAERRREQERARKLRRMVIALAIGLLLALIAGLIAWVQREKVKRQNNTLLADNLAGRVRTVFKAQPVTGLLLAVEAVQRARLGSDPDLPDPEEALRWALASTGGRPLPSGRVTAVAATPDRRWLVTAGEDRAVRIWDLGSEDPAASGRILAQLDRKADALALSGDRHWLLTKRNEGAHAHVFLQSLDSKKKADELPEEDWLDGNVPFSPDSRWLITSETGEPVLRDLKAGPRHSLGSHDVQAWAFSPDSRWLALASTAGLVELRDLRSADPTLVVSTLPGSEDPLESLAFGPDGHWLAAANERGTARAWRLNLGMPSGAAILSTQCRVEGRSRVSLGPGSKWLLLTGETGACLSKTESGLPVPLPLPGLDQAKTRKAELSADGRLLILPATEGTAVSIAWLEEPLQPTGTRVLQKHIEPIRFIGSSPDGRWVVIQGGDEPPRLLDAHRGLALADVEPETVAEASDSPLAISPDGSWFADSRKVNGRAGEVVLRSLTGSPRFRKLRWGDPNPVPFRTWAVAPGGAWLAAVDTEGGLRLWRFLDGELRPIPGVAAPAAISALTFSPEGGWLAAGTRRGDVLLWNLRSPQPTRRELVSHPPKGVTAVAFSPEGRWLATAGGDGRIRRYGLEGEEPRPVVVRAPDEISIAALALSRGGEWLAAANETGEVVLWQPGEEEHTLGNRSGVLQGLGFSPDGSLLAGFSRSGFAQLWRLGKRTAARPVSLTGPGLTGPVSLAEPEGRVQALAFSLDGRVLTASDGLVRQWEPRLDRLLKLACQTAGRNLTENEWDDNIPSETYQKGEPCSELAAAQR